MKKSYFIILVGLSVLTISGVSTSTFPQAEITNGLIYARIYLPDADSGYYRSTRFDWSGVMPDLEYKGHTYSGQWFDKYDPTIHDAIMGPVESFSPLGYDEAKPGSSFTQIGVGLLAKPSDAPYSPFTYYKILDAGKWSIKKKANEIDFMHELAGSEYAYQYKKSINVVKGKPEMILTHSLKNTGHQSIETEVYDHNLFVIDHQPTGPDFVIKFPFNLTSEEQGRRGIGDIAAIEKGQIIFLRELNKKEYTYSVMQGYSNSAKDYDIRIENHKTGAGMRITSDRPLSKLVFWASPRILCPEPYINIKIAPGEVFNWKLCYEFYINDTTNKSNKLIE
ncbi:MAG: hypothetical protein ABIR66_13785 [Saprospiraceae bacterium]